MSLISLKSQFVCSYLLAHVPLLVTIADVLLVYLLVYQFLLWVTKSHVASLFRGLFLIFILYLLSLALGLSTLNWILEKFATVLVLLLIIIFQPELRHLLEKLGMGDQRITSLLDPEKRNTSVIKRLLKAIESLAKEKMGAIIVIEGQTPLDEYIASGIPINGNISIELITTLFWPKSPTHDGAIILKGDKIAAAGCLLPLTNAPLADRRLGTRHRAAIGLSDISDATIIVVSEETGIISLAEFGMLTRYLTKEDLETRFFNLYQGKTRQKKLNWKQIWQIWQPLEKE